jgi:hypothetical protein
MFEACCGVIANEVKQSSSPRDGVWIASPFGFAMTGEGLPFVLTFEACCGVIANEVKQSSPPRDGVWIASPFGFAMTGEGLFAYPCSE